MSKAKISFENNLNPEQFKIVTHGKGPVLILAGAGTGKTRVLTHRVAYLIQELKVFPEKILAVTFTNKATNEMRERLQQMLGSYAGKIWIATFHSMSLRILRHHAHLLNFERDFLIYDTQDSKSVIKQVIKKLGLNESNISPQEYLGKIDRLKNKFISPEQFKADRHDDMLLADIYDAYQKELIKAQAMDFGDLLFNCLRLLEEQPDVRKLYQRTLDFILVDEFQDTNMLQYRIVKHLAEPKNNLLVVGDDDQSIYAFRGADISNILSFEQDYQDTAVYKLEQNYRSTQAILDAAHEIICKNKDRKEKKLWTAGEQGEPIELFAAYNEEEEAQNVVETIANLKAAAVPYQQCAVFYRTNAQSRALEEAFLQAGVPYRIYGGFKFYERKEIKDLLAYLRLIHNLADNQSLIRIINTPRRGVGAQSLKQIVNYADQSGLSFFESAEQLVKRNKKLAEFCKMIRELRTGVEEGLSTFDLINEIIDRVKYLDFIGADQKFEDAREDSKYQEKAENIKELVSIAAKFSIESDKHSLTNFLDHIALMTAVDQVKKSEEDEEFEQDFVSLMTLHLAKGLEFPYVFFTGLEEGLVPHVRSIEEDSIAEERRLCYVGVSRAMLKLYLSYAKSRGMYNAQSSFGYGGYHRELSRFVYDIPSHLIAQEHNNQSTIMQEEDFFDADFEDYFNDLPDENSAISDSGAESGFLKVKPSDRNKVYRRRKSRILRQAKQEAKKLQKDQKQEALLNLVSTADELE